MKITNEEIQDTISLLLRVIGMMSQLENASILIKPNEEPLDHKEGAYYEGSEVYQALRIDAARLLDQLNHNAGTYPIATVSYSDIAAVLDLDEYEPISLGDMQRIADKLEDAYQEVFAVDLQIIADHVLKLKEDDDEYPQ